MSDRKPINFLLCGVGGQGTILASDVLVNVGLEAGYQAKQAEVHGMSQRGGSVTSHVRWGERVHSPLVGAGEVDVLVAFEKLEALRNLGSLRQEGLALVNDARIEPLTVISGDQAYPDDETVKTAFGRRTARTTCIDGEALAGSLGEPRVVNVVLLGALAALLERDPLCARELTADTWLGAIAQRVPEKHLELNRAAFKLGRAAIDRSGD